MFIMIEAKQPFNTYQDNERTFISIKFNPMNACSIPLAHDLFENFMLIKDPAKRSSLPEVLSHSFFTDFSPTVEEIRNFQFKPEIIPNNQPEVFLRDNFDTEFTSMKCSLDDSDVRMIGSEEDKVFSNDKFNWMNQKVIKSYVTNMK